MSIAGVVLAAGESSRLGEPKQLVRDAHGETLVHRTARALLEVGCIPVFVIVGAGHEAVGAAVANINAHIVMNPEWREGIASSIRGAVSAALAHQQSTGVAKGDRLLKESDAQPGDGATAIDALLFTTCDMPTVGVEHLQALCTAFIGGATRVASRYGEENGSTVGIPAVIGTREWSSLLQLQGDRGAKALLMSADTETIWLQGGSFDLDTPQDLHQWSGE